MCTLNSYKVLHAFPQSHLKSIQLVFVSLKSKLSGGPIGALGDAMGWFCIGGVVVGLGRLRGLCDGVVLDGDWVIDDGDLVVIVM